MIKKIISNQPVIINQIQPFTLSDIHNLSRRFYASFRKITAAMQRGYVHAKLFRGIERSQVWHKRANVSLVRSSRPISTADQEG